jgi:peptide/nickel transport system permease protein
MNRNQSKVTRFVRSAREWPLSAICLLLPVVICGLFGSFFIPHDPTVVDPTVGLLPPSWLVGQGFAHVCGTDYLGRDVLSRVIVGARSTLIVGLVGVGLAGIVGTFFGLLGGYMGRGVDMLVMRLVDIQMSIPGILLALLVAASLGAGLVSVIVVIAIVFWTAYARVVRGEAMSIKNRDYVVMARVLGSPTKRTIRKHIFPNVMDSAVVVATLQLGLAVMIEASLSFLGLGVQPPAVAWGKMIAESRLYMATAWWLPTFPGLAIMITVLGANLLGDWLRDKLDPKLRQM